MDLLNRLYPKDSILGCVEKFVLISEGAQLGAVECLLKSTGDSVRFDVIQCDSTRSVRFNDVRYDSMRSVKFNDVTQRCR